MAKLLHYSFLSFFLLILNLGYSQSDHKTKHVNHDHEHKTLLDKEHSLVDNHSTVSKRILPFGMIKIVSKNNLLKHNATEGISLLDIINSDEGADFNCSGGFCMNKFHFHKKGLTLKRQLFGYFIRIAC